MFERFTERARNVITLAQDEARTHKHDHIGTEHILLGVVREEQGLGARVLDSLDITVEEVREQIEATIGLGDSTPTGMIPFTPRAKEACEAALRAALSLGHTYIGTEHILLGLTGDKNNAAVRILLNLGIDAETVRSQVNGMLASSRRTPSERSTGAPKRRMVTVCCPSCGSSIVETMGTLEPPGSFHAHGEGELECPACSTSWTGEWAVRLTRL